MLQQDPREQAHYEVSLDSGESDWMRWFRHELNQRLKSWKRAEIRLFEFVYQNRDRLSEEGKDPVDLFVECAKESGISKGAWDRFVSWFHARGNMDDTLAKKIDVNAAIGLTKYVREECIFDVAKKIASDPAADQSWTQHRVQAVAKDMGAEKPRESKKAKPIRELVRRWKRHLSEIRGTKGLSSKVREELDGVIAEMGAYLERSER